MSRRLTALVLSTALSVGAAEPASDPKAPTAESLRIDRASVKKDLAASGGLGCGDLKALVQTLCLTKLKSGCELDYLQMMTVAKGAEPERAEKACGVMARRLQKKVSKAPDFAGTLGEACLALKTAIEGANCFDAPQSGCKDLLRGLVSANEVQCGMAQKMVKLAPQP